LNKYQYIQYLKQCAVWCEFVSNILGDAAPGWMHGV